MKTGLQKMVEWLQDLKRPAYQTHDILDMARQFLSEEQAQKPTAPVGTESDEGLRGELRTLIRCFCDKKSSEYEDKKDTEMELVYRFAYNTAAHFADELDKILSRYAPQEQLAKAWEETAAQMSRNADYYRGLVVKIGEMFGENAYISDDGSKQDSVLCAKVPELVQELIHRKKQEQSDEGKPTQHYIVKKGDWQYRSEENHDDIEVRIQSHSAAEAVEPVLWQNMIAIERDGNVIFEVHPGDKAICKKA